MYAVLKTGGKQYKVSQNDVIIVERLSGESGAKINLDKVLMIGEGENTTVGTPTIEGALVAAEVLEHKRGDKITVSKEAKKKLSTNNGTPPIADRVAYYRHIDIWRKKTFCKKDKSRTKNWHT